MNLLSVVGLPLQFRSSHRPALDLQLGLQEDSTDSIIEQGKHGRTRDVYSNDIENINAIDCNYWNKKRRKES